MGITVAELTAQIRAEGADTAVRQVQKLGVEGDITSQKLVAGNQAASRSFGGMVKNAAVVAGSLFAIKKAADVMLSSISTAQDFEAAISDLSAITGAAGDDLEFLAEKSREFGAATTLSATQAAEAFKLIASAKPDLLENGEALAVVTKEAITLAEAAGSTLPEAASTLGSALNQFGAEADQAGRFINVLAAGAKFGASEIADTAAALRDSGTVAADANVSFEELNAGIQALSTVSIKGSRAGVGLRNVILKLQKEGVDELNPSVVGLTAAMENLAAKNLDTTELMKIFGLENVVVAKSLIAQAGTLGALTQKLTGTATAYEQADIKVNNLQGDLKKLGSAWEEFQLSIVGDTDPLRSAVQGTTDVVIALGENIDTLVIAGEGFAALAAGKIVASLGAATSASIAKAAATRTETLATLNNASAETGALKVKAAYVAAELEEAAAAVAAATGIQKLTIAENVLVPAQIRAAAAANAHTASLAAQTAAATAAFGSFTKLRGVMALLGGPIGIITTAATALAFWALTADDAEASTDAFNDSIENLSEKLTSVDIESSIKKTTEQIAVYRDAIDRIKDADPGVSGEARVKALASLIIDSKSKLSELSNQLDIVKAKEKEISEVVSGKPKKEEAPEFQDTFNQEAQTRIEALQRSLLNEKDLIEENYLDRKFIVETAIGDDINRAKERSQLLKDIEQQRADALKELNEKELNEKVSRNERENDIILSKLDALDISLQSEEDREFESYARRWDMLQDAVERDLKTQEEADEIEANLFANHQARLTNIANKGLSDRQRFQAKTGQEQTKQVFGELASLTQGVAQHNKGLFRINQIAGAANALIAAHEGASQSLKAYPMPLAAIMAGLHYAAGIARVNAIRSASFSGGGGGGTAPSLAGSSPAPIVGNIPVQQQTDQRIAGAPTQSLTVIFQGDMIGWDEHIQERVIGGIRNEIDNNDLTIMSTDSRQAQELLQAG